MYTLAVGKFKAECLSHIKHVAQSHEEVIITKYGKPIAKLVSVDQQKKNENKPLKNMASFIGDVVSPVDEAWEAEE